MNTIIAGTTLNEAEALELSKCIQIIRKGLSNFIEVGSALMKIRDLQLFRSSAPSFEAFCRASLGMSKQYSYSLMACSDVVHTLESRAEFAGRLPQNEAQARPLKPLEGEVLVDTWKEVLEQSGVKPITSSLVRAVAKKRLAAAGGGEPATAPEPMHQMKRSIQTLRKVMESASGDYSKGLALVEELEALLAVSEVSASY